MKKSIYLTALITLLAIYGTHAQSFNFGIKGGANFSNFNGDSPSFESESISSYHAGVFLELGVSNNFSFQPEILYSTVGANVSFNGASQDFKNEIGYISVPLMARIYLIPKRLSLDLGPQVSFVMNESENVNISDSNTFDFAVCGGVTLNVLGPLFIQGRYNLGLTEVKPDAEVTNRVVQLTAGLRF